MRSITITVLVIVIAAITVVAAWRIGVHQGAAAGAAAAPAATVAAADLVTALPADVDPPHRSIAMNVDAPLPQVDTPLVDIFVELKARSAAGDAAAASRLFRDLARCRMGMAEMHGRERGAALLLANRVDDGDTRLLDAAEYQLASVEAWREWLTDTCVGLDEEQLDEVSEIQLRAAELGDAGARYCYLHLGPLRDMGALVRHPEALAAYATAAPGLLQAGFDAGDWSVLWLWGMALTGYNPGLLEAVVKPDAVEAYRYLSLLRLGILDSATDASSRDFALQRFEFDLARIGDQLSARQRAAALDWALAHRAGFPDDATAASIWRFDTDCASLLEERR